MADIVCYDSNGEIITSIYQWDVDRQVRLEGGAAVDLTNVSAVHVTNKGQRNAVGVDFTTSGNGVVLVIPNYVLRKTADIAIYLVEDIADTEERTIYQVTIPLIARPMPITYSDSMEWSGAARIFDDIDLDDYLLAQEGNNKGRITVRKVLELSGIAELAAVVDGKQDALTAGENITITGNVISATGGGSAEAVLYTEQSLTNAQKEQARTNINAANAATVTQIGNALSAVDSRVQTVETAAVRADEEQIFSAAEQAQARSNIGAYSAADAATAAQQMQIALQGKQDALTFDADPTDRSSNPVTSDGIARALNVKLNTSDISSYVPDASSDTPSDLGTAAAGVDTEYARADHVHDFNADFKAALLQIAEKVTYIDVNGQQYYDALYSALYHRYLSSITAVFTQGGATIYDTDSLDDLKQYLVVTANYSDSTTETVTAYELSGTLTAGTSTIMVSYGGKTDTFTVTVTAADPLPSDYTRVLYVASLNTVSTGPHIDTGVTLSESGDIGIDITFMLTAESNANKYFISAPNSTGASIGVGVCVGSDNKTVSVFNGIASSILPNGDNSILNQKISVSATCTATSSSITDGTHTDSQTGTGRTHAYPVGLWGLRRGDGTGYLSYPASGRIYSVTVTDGGSAVLNLIPCTRNSDNTAGFYNTVNSTFVTASGLTAGVSE